MRKILVKHKSSIEVLILTFCNTFFQLSIEYITIFADNWALNEQKWLGKDDKRNDLRCIDPDHSYPIVNSLLDFEKQVDKLPAFHDLGMSIHSKKKISIIIC